MLIDIARESEGGRRERERERERERQRKRERRERKRERKRKREKDGGKGSPIKTVMIDSYQRDKDATHTKATMHKCLDALGRMSNASNPSRNGLLRLSFPCDLLTQTGVTW